MPGKKVFSFKENKDLVKTTANTFNRIISGPNLGINNKNNDITVSIIREVLKLLNGISQLDGGDLDALDFSSKYTREVEIPSLFDTFYKIAKQGNQITIDDQNVENIIFFIALLSQEATCTFYTTQNAIPIGRVNKVQDVIQLMDIFPAQYFNAYKRACKLFCVTANPVTLAVYPRIQ